MAPPVALLSGADYRNGDLVTRNPAMSDTPRDDLPEAARRALAEAEARRRAAKPAALPTELGGREGPEPVRFGDWEKKGIAVDF
jgi:hypothetical protein